MKSRPQVCATILATTLLIGFTPVSRSFACDGDAPQARACESEATTPSATSTLALHAIRPCRDSWIAFNRGQSWTTTFDRRGFTVEPLGVDWSWGLQLESFGRSAASTDLKGEAKPEVDGNRMTYQWEDGLSEWFINDPSGLEHGYTLAEEPSGSGNELVLTLSIRGTLEPLVLPGGTSIKFADEEGATVLTYSGLKVFDADGATLKSGFELAPDRRLRLRVDAGDAKYPITIDPVAQQSYLKASNTRSLAKFGSAVAMSGDTIVIGSASESSASPGVNGDDSDTSATGAGAAYVYTRTMSGWVQEAYLKASNAEAGDSFGVAVAISGDTIVVGTTYEDSSASGVNGDETDNSLDGSGAAYVFVRSGTTWTQQAYLKASHPDAGDWFGYSVGCSGDTVVVGARLEGGGGSGTTGDPADNSGPQTGAAYVFFRTGTNWSQQAYLKATNPGGNDQFARHLDLDGDTLVVGAQGEDSNATGVGGAGSDNSAPHSGAAYVYRRTGTTWVVEAYIKATNAEAGDAFGFSVSIDADVLAVGAWSESGGGTGTTANPNSNSKPGAGAVYVYRRTGTTWIPEAYIKASNTDGGDAFGLDVDIEGDSLVVGAPWEQSNGVGMHADQSDNSLNKPGAAYVFARAGGSWRQTAYVKATNTGADPSPFGADYFGWSLAQGSGRLIVGAMFEDGGSSGVNGDQFDISEPSSGAAYVYQLEGNTPPGNAFCFGDGSGAACPCTNGTNGAGCATSVSTGAALSASGIPEVHNDSFALTISGLPPGVAGLCIKGLSQLGGGQGNPVGDGLLCLNPQLRSHVIVSDGNGLVLMDNWRGMPFSSYAGAATLGVTSSYQWWFRDPGNTCSGQGFNFSNAWETIWR